MTHSLHIGFDIGGTNIDAGLLDNKGNLIVRTATAFPGKGDTDALMHSLYNTALNLCQKAPCSPEDILTLGCATAGSIKSDGTSIIHAHNLGLHNFPLLTHLQQLFPQKQIAICNDANAAAAAELHLGALRGYSNAVMLTLGTGVGCALILDGKLFNGGRGNGVEAGHMMLKYGEASCSCGQKGCFEAYCSAAALMRHAEQPGHKDSLLSQLKQIRGRRPDAQLVAECVSHGDEAALCLWDDFTDHLAAALGSLVNLLDPQCIVIGGGLANSGDLLFAPLREKLRSHCFFDEPSPILQAQLGTDAGLTGASLLAQQQYQQ